MLAPFGGPRLRLLRNGSPDSATGKEDERGSLSYCTRCTKGGHRLHPTSRRATFERCSVFMGGVRLGVLGVVLIVCACRCRGCCSLSVCVCVCVRPVDIFYLTSLPERRLPFRHLLYLPNLGSRGLPTRACVTRGYINYCYAVVYIIPWCDSCAHEI